MDYKKFVKLFNKLKIKSYIEVLQDCLNWASVLSLKKKKKWKITKTTKNVAKDLKNMSLVKKKKRIKNHSYTEEISYLYKKQKQSQNALKIKCLRMVEFILQII